MSIHRPDRADSPGPRPSAERAKRLTRSVEATATVGNRVRHLRWRERIATLLGHTLPMRARLAWAAASGESISWINGCASPADADRKTFRLVDVLFLPAEERALVLAAIEEWAQAIERGEL